MKTVTLISFPENELWEARHLRDEFNENSMWTDWQPVYNGDKYHDDWEYRQINKSSWLDDNTNCFANKPQARELISSFCNRVLTDLVGIFNYADVKDEFVKLGVEL